MENAEPGSQLGTRSFTNVSFLVKEIMKWTIVAGIVKLQWFSGNDCLNSFSSLFEASLTAEKYHFVPCQNNCDFVMKDIKRFSTINDGFISSQLVSCISNIVYLNSFTRVNTLQCTYTGLCKRMMLNNNDRKFILKISPHMFQLTSADLRHGLI